MSNKIKLASRPAIRRSARCPDCRSRVSGKGERLSIRHDPECPAMAVLLRQGRASVVAVVVDPDSPEVPRQLQRLWYGDLHRPAE